MPGAGGLNDRIAFERRTEIDDGRGNPESGEFLPQFECAAQFTPRFGGEEVMAARLAGRQPVTVRVRSFKQTREVKSEWRIRDVRTDDIYNIRSVMDPFAHTSQRRLWLDFLCETGVAT